MDEPIRYRVTRNVAADDPGNYSGREIRAGATLYRWEGPTYGAVDWIHGSACTIEPNIGPFFEFPRDALA